MSGSEAEEHRPRGAVGAPPDPTAAGGGGPGADAPDGRPAGFEPPSIARGGLSALVFRAIELVALTLLVIVTGRLMEPAGRGLYALSSLTTNLLLIPLGPVWVANAVEMQRRRVSLPEILGGTTAIAVVGGIATALVAFAIAPLFGDNWWVVALPAAVTPFLLLLNYEEGYYTGLGHVEAVNRIRVAKAVVPLVFIAPPLLAGASPRTAIAIWTLSFVALAIVIFFPLRSLVGGPRLPADRGFYRRVITYGGKISALRAIDTLNDRVGLLALAAFATEAAVGVFSVAVAAFEVLMLAPRALLLSAFRRIGISSPGSSAALTCRALRHSFLFTAVGGPLLLPFVWIGVPLTLGDGYQDVPWLFAILIPNAVCRAVLACLYTYFQIQARSPATLLKVGGWALVANVGLTIALTPTWGTWGVAVAASLSGVIGAAVAFREFHKESGTRAREVIPGRAELADYLALAASLRRRPATRSGSSA